MRHKVAGYKLGRSTSHRKALLRSLITSIIEQERIVTTVIKAKAVRPLVERMITLAKRDDLHARRQAAAILTTPDSVKKLFEKLGTRFGQRGGSCGWPMGRPERSFRKRGILIRAGRSCRGRGRS